MKNIALVDCNNFFVSCERIFNPDLWNVPTIVLSNNDGCAVARSQEAKDAGIPMGAPLFKIKDIVLAKGVRVLSSNFMLYGDISRRVMDTLDQFSDSVEIYSIDEAFLGVPSTLPDSELVWGNKIVRTVMKNIGVPVSVGIAETKTLAKLANEFAKTKRRFNSVTDLSVLNDEAMDHALSKLEAGDIWGIGWRNSSFLKRHGIFTALDFKHADRRWVRKHLSVVGERTHLELHRIPCFTVDNNPTPRKGIASTRSFGQYVNKKSDLREAVSTYVARAARKLRKQESVARYVTVYIRTNYHTKHLAQYSNAITVDLGEPTDYTPTLIKHALLGLDAIYKREFMYKKAGIYLTGISDKHSFPRSLFSNSSTEKVDTKSKLMQEIDKLNSRFGGAYIRVASEGLSHNWKVKSEFVSNRYTTNWNEILRISI